MKSKRDNQRIWVPHIPYLWTKEKNNYPSKICFLCLDSDHLHFKTWFLSNIATDFDEIEWQKVNIFIWAQNIFNELRINVTIKPKNIKQDDENIDWSNRYRKFSDSFEIRLSIVRLDNLPLINVFTRRSIEIRTAIDQLVEALQITSIWNTRNRVRIAYVRLLFWNWPYQ